MTTRAITALFLFATLCSACTAKGVGSFASPAGRTAAGSSRCLELRPGNALTTSNPAGGCIQVGAQLIGADCTRALTLPSPLVGATGNTKITPDLVTIPIVGGACHLVAAAKGQVTRIYPSSDSPPDVVVLADFIVSGAAGGLVQLAARCGPTKCLSAQVQSPSGLSLLDVHADLSTTTIDQRPVPFEAGHTYRMVILARGDGVNCYMDGELVGAGTTSLTSRGFATVAILNEGGSGPAVMDVLRFYVFAPATA